MRTQLMVAVSSIMVLGLGLILVLDYRSERARRLSDKATALDDEAALLVPMIQQLRHHGLESVQDYIDSACAAMQEATSPGHHIAVQIGPTVLQARSHHRATPQMLQALQAGAEAPDHRAEVNDEPVLVGTAQRDDVTAYVSEYVANVLIASRRDMLWRSAWIALVGVVATAIMDVILVRLIAHPIGRLAGTVQRIGQGELGSQAEGLNSSELQFLAGELNAMSASLASDEAERRRGMDKARRIQGRLLPSAGRVGGWVIASLYRPADEVGGDYLDYRLAGEGVLIACVADVTGHGVPAAMGAAMLKTLFAAAVTRSCDPAQILRYVHEGFASVSLDEDFASMIVVTLDQAAGRLRYASAGHEPAYLLRPGEAARPLGSTGMLLGIEGLGAEWTVAELELRPGDRLALVTDGWAEARLDDGRVFGRDSLVAALQEGASQAPERMVQTALDRLCGSGALEPAADDRTLMVVDWPVPPPALGGPFSRMLPDCRERLNLSAGPLLPRREELGQDHGGIAIRVDAFMQQRNLSRGTQGR